MIVAGTTTILTLLFGIIGAYALARLRFRGKGAVLWLIMACSMFPLVVLLPPLLKMFSSTEPFTWFPYWINTYQSVIIPGLSFGLPLAVWNLTAFFKQLPVELEQAAMVDGCTPGVAFRKVILPLAAPGVFTTAIIVFIGAWNEFLLALTFLQDPSRQTATVAISKFTGTSGFDTPYGTIMAAGVRRDRSAAARGADLPAPYCRRPYGRWRQVAVRITTWHIWRSRNAAAAPDLFRQLRPDS